MPLPASPRNDDSLTSSWTTECGATVSVRTHGFPSAPRSSPTPATPAPVRIPPNAWSAAIPASCGTHIQLSRCDGVVRHAIGHTNFTLLRLKPPPAWFPTEISGDGLGNRASQPASLGDTAGFGPLASCCGEDSQRAARATRPARAPPARSRTRSHRLCAPQPAGESPDGTLVGHRLVVASGHDPSTEQNVLLLANLCIARDREGSSRAVEFERLFSLIHHGAPTCLATCDVATDTVAVVSGSSLGTLHVLTLVVPRYPGSGPEDGRQVSYQETDVLHAGGVTAADVHAGQLRLATAGADGALHLHDMRRMGEPAGTSKGPPRKGATARALCWVSYHEVVTAR